MNEETTKLESGNAKLHQNETNVGYNYTNNASILSYVIFSSMLVILNKIVTDFFSISATILFLQMGTCAFIIWILGKMKYLEVIELKSNIVKEYFRVAASFFFYYYSNIRLLDCTNVGTFITLQTVASMGIACIEYKIAKNSLPSKQFLFSFLIIIIACVLYIDTDPNYTMTRRIYFWVIAYFIATLVDHFYMKKIIDSYDIPIWGKTYYNCILSLPILSLIIFLNSEHLRIGQLLFEGISLGDKIIIFICCFMVFGLYMSEFLCRGVSVSFFSVLGHINKFLIVILNFALIREEESTENLICLLICLFGGTYSMTLLL